MYKDLESILKLYLDIFNKKITFTDKDIPEVGKDD